MGGLRIGTSGWNYPSGQGTWNGVFYPPAKTRPKGFDELGFYAEHFDTVEVNSTFYGQPRASVTRKWADRTPEHFEFSVKLYQKFTHPRMYEEVLRRSLHAAEGHDEAVRELVKPSAADLDEFRRGIEPLASAGKLGAVLAQFPPSFKRGRRRSRLPRSPAAGARRISGRRGTSSSAAGATPSIRRSALLNDAGAAWVQIDEPKFRFSIRQNRLPNVKGFYYMRLHGRNAAQWWKHDKSEDRYNYLYSGDELKDISETADAARRIVRKAYLYTNNHFSAKSVANAAMIKQQLGEPIEGEYPPEFVAQYPGPRGRRAGEERRLFPDEYAADLIANLQFRRNVLAFDHLADDDVLAVEFRARVEHDVQLAVGLRRLAHVREPHGQRDVLVLQRSLGHADRFAARGFSAASPERTLLGVAGLRIAELHQEAGNGTMHALAVIEACFASSTMCATDTGASF